VTAELPFTLTGDGLRLMVRLTPRAGRDQIDGIVAGPDGRMLLAVRVSAPPVEGAANAALIACLADALALRKSAITIRSGESARVKQLHLAGDGAAIAARIAALVR
jgi:uncharacterized protein (TIGR00251 family)